MFKFLGLRGVRAEFRFGGEVGERVDRFVLSEGARVAVQEMYAELGSESLTVRYEAELVEAL